MVGDRLLRYCTHSYGWLVGMLRQGDSRERDEMRGDGERWLRDARAQGHLALARVWFGLVWDLLFVGVRHDASQAVRALIRAPGATVGIAVLLATGVAATSTLFAFVDVALLCPLPYDQPDRLVLLTESNPTQGRAREGVSPGTFLDWEARNDAFDAMTAAMTVNATLRHADSGLPVRGAHVTSHFFDVYRRQPSLGRTFSRDEFDGAASITSRQPSRGNPVLILSHRLWQTLGGDPLIVGRRLVVENREWEVVGVMPPDLAVPDATVGFWAPWDVRSSYQGARFADGPPRDARFLRVTGRLKAGLPLEAASARMDVVTSALALQHPATNSGWKAQVLPLAEEVGRASRAELLAVFFAMACLLLLLCANMASLSIARGTARAREMAIRLSLGATRGRVTRQLVAESALTAAVAVVLSLLLSGWWIEWAVSIAPPSIPRLHEVGMSWRVVSFAAAATLLAITLGQVLPSLGTGRGSLTTTLKDAAPVTTAKSGVVRAGLVVAEMAVSVMLLAGAVLLARTFVELRRVDLGFDTRNLLVLRITPDAGRYRTDALTTEYYGRVLSALSAVPGVSSAAAVTSLPLSALGSDFTRPFWPEDAPAGATTPSVASIRMATPDYFQTLGLRVDAGREFGASDHADAPRVVIVNEKLAKQAWSASNPVGRRLVLDYQGGAYPYEVVGVVQDARGKGPRSEPIPEIFIPHAQNPYLVMNVVARTTKEPMSVARAALAAVRQVDTNQPVHPATTMDRLLGEALETNQFAMILVVLFATAGLVTATGGIYALFAYLVAKRRREIALRLALGASPSGVARAVVWHSLALAGAGGVAGIAAAVASGRVLDTLLFGVDALDPLAPVTAAVVLCLVAAMASWPSARRASRIDPVRALRE